MQEKTVQKRAIQFLQSYYYIPFFRTNIYAAQEVRTKKVFGGKRADGLLAFQNWFLGKPYVISVEAKSIKTVAAMQSNHDSKRWWRNSLRFGIGVGLVLIFILLLLPIVKINWIHFLLIILMVSFFFGIITRHTHRHQTIDVLRQLKYYPANEQWLAFSSEGFRSLNNVQQDLLEKICQNRGIGLLLVGTKKSVTVQTKPRKRWSFFWDTRGKWHWISDFLDYYSKGEEIKKKLRGQKKRVML